MGWRDNNFVLFTTTIGDLTATITRPRKRLVVSSSTAAKTRLVFGDEVVKDLEIPVLIDQYNQHMGAVDHFDQLKSYYDTLRSHRKTWRPPFSYLLEIILVNSFKLSTLADRAEAKQSGHRRFRLQLVTQLEDTAGRAPRWDSHRRKSVNDLKIDKRVIHTRGNLYQQGKAQPCVICQATGHRSPLQAINANASRRSVQPGQHRAAFSVGFPYVVVAVKST